MSDSISDVEAHARKTFDREENREKLREARHRPAKLCVIKCIGDRIVYHDFYSPNFEDFFELQKRQEKRLKQQLEISGLLLLLQAGSRKITASTANVIYFYVIFIGDQTLFYCGKAGNFIERQKKHLSDAGLARAGKKINGGKQEPLAVDVALALADHAFVFIAEATTKTALRSLEKDRIREFKAETSRAFLNVKGGRPSAAVKKYVEEYRKNLRKTRLI